MCQDRIKNGYIPDFLELDVVMILGALNFND